MRLFFGNGKVASTISNSKDIVISKQQCNIEDIDCIKKTLFEYRPEVVINSAAKTNLEYCQSNKIESFKSNVVGVVNLIESCKEFNIKLVHISSGCLFDGNETVSTEESVLNPKVWYTWTKTWADQIIEQYGYKNYLILRPRQLISKKPNPTNMLTKFLCLEKIEAIKEPNSLTCVEDFGQMLDHLTKIDAVGIFNCCNDGVLSPYDIAIKIKEKIKPSLEVKECTYKDFLEKIQNKRVNTILSNEKLKSSGFFPRSAKDALDWCVENYGK